MTEEDDRMIPSLSAPDPIDVRKARWNRFMALDPSVKRIRIVHCHEGEQERPRLWPENRRQRTDWVVSHYNWQAGQALWLDDDKVPHLDFSTGTEIFAEAFGCTVHRPKNNMPFALPLVFNASEASRLKTPELSASTLAYLFDMADDAIALAGKGIPLRLPDVQSPMDIAALIWEKSDFYVAMIEDPEAVRELAGKVRNLLTAFLDEWFRRYGTGFVAHYPPYFMEGGMTLSEDEVGAVNAAMFEAFFLPELVSLSNRYGGIGMHCCANSRHQWPGFRRIPNLRLLNIVQPADVVADAFPFFNGHVAQWHACTGEAPPFNMLEGLHPETHLVLETSADTREEAIRLAEYLKTLG
jgi:hypothetical protein